MDLTPSVVRSHAEAYRREEPLYTVEQEQIETLPGAFAAGAYGRRDAEWVVRWYYRRFLGAYPNADRRAIEERFADNDVEAVRRAIARAAERRDGGPGDSPTAEGDAGTDAGEDVDADTDRSTSTGTEATPRPVDAADLHARLGALTALDGVDVPVASGFLMFLDPSAFVVCGEREWSVLREAGELADPYPDAPSPADYERYLRTCRGVAADCDCDMWTLYRALWRLWKDRD
jgi:hypothetical protein